ncbi:hypothetical protein Unana1_04076 [Umbelopsis nana]
MLHLLGVNLPDRKLVSTALQYFYGIGATSSTKICDQLSIHKQCKLSELSEAQINSLSNVLANMNIETDLKRQVREHVMHHRSINTYVGRRHAMSLPVRGQRTRNNAKTAKKLNGRWVQRRMFSSLSTDTFPSVQSPLERFFNTKFF